MGRRSLGAVLCLLVMLAGACTDGSKAPPRQDPDARSSDSSTEPAQRPARIPCDTLKSDDGPVVVTHRRRVALPRSSALQHSKLPGVFPSAAVITAESTSLLDDPPGQVRMIAFWGEPGANEPTESTPITFLGIDGRWRKLTKSDLGDDLGYLSSGSDTLSPDGSRWVIESRGWNRVIDFGTGEFAKLSKGDFLKYARWSPDSRSVALWTIRQPGVEIFSRSGRRIAQLQINVGKRSAFMLDGRRLAVFDPVARRSPARLHYTIFDLSGHPVEHGSCVLPAGYPPRSTGVDGFDGRHLWISALISSDRQIYRYSSIDVSAGKVIYDTRYTGTAAYVEQVVQPGLYVTGIVGAPDGIYAMDPQTGDMIRVSRIRLYPKQQGYENHANDQFSRDLIFGN